jgi:hypothetical protein
MCVCVAALYVGVSLYYVCIAKLWNTPLGGEHGKGLQEAMQNHCVLYKSGDNVLLLVDQWDGEGEESTTEHEARKAGQVRHAGHLPLLPLHEQLPYCLICRLSFV